MIKNIDILIKAFVFFIILLVLTRFMGRKQLSQLTFFDYIVGITIGSITANAITDSSLEITRGLTALVVWAVMPIFIGYIALKNLPFRRAVDSTPLVVIKDGVILDKNMAKAQYNTGDLLMQLRERDVFDITEVEYAILEPNGHLSVLRKPEYTAATNKDLHLPASENGPMTELILNGKVLTQNLDKLHRTEDWLNDELKKRNLQGSENIIFAGLLNDGQLYVAVENNRTEDS